MSGFELDIPADFLQELFSYEFEDISKEMLEEASPILVESTKSAMRAVVKHSGDSEMINSVKASKPKVTNTDACIVNVHPSGYSKHVYSAKGNQSRKYPVSNSLKAIWLQYGVAGRQPPRDWLNRAVNSCQGEVLDTMQKVWESKVAK